MKTNAERVFKKANAEAVFTTCGYMKKYLTGFSFEDGYVLTDSKGTTMYTDARYMESAKKYLADKGIEAVLITNDNSPEALLKKYKTVAIPFAETSMAEYQKLQKSGATFSDATAAFKEAMEIKTAEEIGYIQKACEIAEDGFLKLLPEIKEGMTESEVAAILEYNMRSLGAYSTSFDTIVAFGANASVPHHETGDRKLCFGDEVLIDFGCKVNGYCSDITRTFLFGDDKKHEEFKHIYGEVLTAHNLVQEQFKAGMTGKQGDAIARDYFKSKGLDKFFTHSVGHGIGLNIHEEPRVSSRSETIFENGMVFSDEPGIYMAGALGIRIEDSVRMEGGKVVSFMGKTDKNLIII
jgi:Xaa-Pro aminopeptidase